MSIARAVMEFIHEKIKAKGRNQEKKIKTNDQDRKENKNHE